MTIDEGDKRRLTGQEIHEEGLEGWRYVLDRLVVRYATGDFHAGATLVSRIAEAADALTTTPTSTCATPT